MPFDESDLTICTTVRDAEHYITRWVENMHRMFPKALISIAADLGSTDRTIEVLDHLGLDYLDLIFTRCDAGTGRNLAVKNTITKWLMLVDGDNLLNYPPRFSEDGSLLASIDPFNGSIWAVTGQRELFLRYPFIVNTKWGSTREDLMFYATAPVEMVRCEHFGSDLKRLSHHQVHPFFNVCLTNPGFFRHGMRHRDMIRVIFKLYRGRLYRDAMDYTTMLLSDMITLGRTGWVPVRDAQHFDHRGRP